MWVFLCFGFTHGRLVNCFYLSIPICGADIPVSLVDVAPEGRDSRQSVEVWRRKEACPLMTNEGRWMLLSEYRAKLSQRTKACPLTKPRLVHALGVMSKMRM